MVMYEVAPLSKLIAGFLGPQDREALIHCQLSVQPLSLMCFKVNESSQLVLLAVERGDNHSHKEVK
jgi:hypothetical protein